MTVEQQIRNLDREMRALKAAYQTAGSRLNLITKTLSYSTQENRVNEGGFIYDDLERVVVTLETDRAIPTIAKLELSGNFDTLPTVRRVPYATGARWVVTTNARTVGGSWAATTYNFTVQTLVNGTLSAKMIWE